MPSGYLGQVDDSLCTKCPSGQSTTSDSSCGASSCTKPSISGVNGSGSGASPAIYVSVSLVLLLVIGYLAYSSINKANAVKAASAAMPTPDVEQANANPLHSAATVDTVAATATAIDEAK